MTDTIHGSGVATQTAAGMLRKYAVLTAEIGCSPKQVEHIHFVITQMEKDFMALRVQRDEARDMACRYEEEINQQKVIIQRYWERDPSE